MMWWDEEKGLEGGVRDGTAGRLGSDEIDEAESE